MTWFTSPPRRQLISCALPALLERGLYDDSPADMTLHRDIYWLGRQWAVTGHGIQAVDKKLNMRFDVEASRIWEDDVDQAMRELHWFDTDDFAEALRIARRLSQEAPARFQ